MLNVMIVDDEPVSQNYIRGLIPWEDEGFYLYPPVYSGEEARKILSSSPVDIVLLDIFMPGENGVSLSRFIVDRYPRIAIAAVSSHDDYDYVREILKNGASDYILKHRLNEESLRSALRLIAARTKGFPAADEKAEKRERLRAWLFAGGNCPFPPGVDEVCVSAARVPLESFPENSRGIVVTGIISLMENAEENSAETITLFREPDFFVSVLRFPDFGKKAKPSAGTGRGGSFRNFPAPFHQNNRGKIRQVYNLEYYFRDLPPLNPAVIPSQLRRLLASFPEKGELSAGMGLSLSVFRRKVITAFLAEGNRAGTELILREIFTSVSGEDQGARLAVVRDLGDIFRDFAEEKGIPARFEGLTEWARSRSPGEWGLKFQELARQLTDEAGGAEKEDAYILKARNYLLDHYTGNVTLEEAAAALNISPSYLSRLYKKETGVSFVDALNRIRVDAAKACLLEGKNLKSTAALCGFMSYNYFIQVFRNHTGVTPKEFLQEK